MKAWKTFGHERVKNILDKQMSAGSLAHAYLFSGSVGIGKKTLALELARKILATENLNNHPDFQILDSEGEISAETAVNFIRGLSFKPFVAEKKVAIINNAHNLNQQSSNALLKTLEEPKPGTIIILVSGEGRLLPTIVSRCQVFHFQTFSKTELKNYSTAEGLKTSEEILDLSFGKINRMRELVADKDFFNEQAKLIVNYQNFNGLAVGEKILAVSQYAEQETEQLQKNFLTWMNWQTENLTKNPQNVTKLQAISDAIEALKFNQNKKLVLQGLFLKL